MKDNYKQVANLLQKMRNKHGLESKLDEEVLLLENIKELWDKCIEDDKMKQTLIGG